MTSIILTSDDLAALPPSARDAILALVNKGHLAAQTASTDDDTTGEGHVDLSVMLAKKLVASVQPPTLKVLRAIAAAPEAGFSLRDVEKAVGVKKQGLKGSWAGITKVARRLSGDPDGYLIDWLELEDESDDWNGRLSPMTRSSLRKALGIDV